MQNIAVKIWETEPDELFFIDKETGLHCAIIRHPRSKHLCGYVGVPENHPWHGKCYDAQVKAPEAFLNRKVSVDEIGVMNLLCGSVLSNEQEGLYAISLLVKAHGGLTFADKAYWKDPLASWWFGFDCAHSGDLSPGYDRDFQITGDVYRNMEYVKEVCAKVAADIALAGKEAA